MPVPNIIRGVQDIMQSLPPFGLPIYGFKNPDYHCFVVTPYIKELVQRAGGLELINPIGLGLAVATSGQAGDILGGGLGVIRTGGKLIKKAVSSDYDFLSTEKMFSFLSDLKDLTGIFTIVVPRLNYLHSFHFFGVQPQSFKGFTHFKDKIYNSGEDSYMHYALSPYEYIIGGHPVLNGQTKLEFRTIEVEEHLGNVVRIKHNPVIETVYGSLLKNSILVREGDNVKKGDIIAKVGCSGWTHVPFLYFQVSYIGPRIPIAGNLSYSFRVGGIQFEPHMQCRLLDLKRYYGAIGDHTELFNEVNLHDLKYVFGQHIIPDATLVKKFPIIHSE